MNFTDLPTDIQLYIYHINKYEDVNITNKYNIV